MRDHVNRYGLGLFFADGTRLSGRVPHRFGGEFIDVASAAENSARAVGADEADGASEALEIRRARLGFRRTGDPLFGEGDEFEAFGFGKTFGVRHCSDTASRGRSGR